MNHKIFLAISVLLALFVFTPLPQAGADDFYKGKTIKIVVGFLAGDVYDLWARLYAQYMPKHIPGKPDIIVQNMTGAGSMIAANHVYSVANLTV
jgi:tripartite-type tricarboxylate transporter receptor subunit TctC